MDADEIKRKLEEVDAKMRSKLAELGFTPAQIERQLDKNVPDEVKKAERDEVLAKKFADDLNDPKSGLMDAIVAKVAADIEKQLPLPKPKRKLPLIAGGIAVLAVIGVAVWYFALRETTSSCAKLVGPLAELEQLAGVKLEMRSGHETDYSCYQYVDRQGRAGGSIVNIETTQGTHLESWRRDQASRKFIGNTTFPTALGEATLFIAGDAKQPSPDELLADAQSRVGQSSDPMGAALANLPPGSHVALMQASGKTIKLSLDREVFTVEKATAYVTAVATRAK